MDETVVVAERTSPDNAAGFVVERGDDLTGAPSSAGAAAAVDIGSFNVLGSAARHPGDDRSLMKSQIERPRGHVFGNHAIGIKVVIHVGYPGIAHTNPPETSLAVKS